MTVAFRDLLGECSQSCAEDDPDGRRTPEASGSDDPGGLVNLFPAVMMHRRAGSLSNDEAGGQTGDLGGAT